jgi:hypothetical protein
MPRNTGDCGRGTLHDIAVVTGRGLMWGTAGIATMDMCFLLIDVLSR